MFKKPVRIKNNNQVKGSERKNVKDLFCKNFPNFSEAEVNNLLNNKKEALNCIKLVTHDDQTLQLYCVQKQPLFFVVQGKLIPTVFLLWKIPNLIPCFTIHPQVMNYINSGADLMMPGLVTPPSQSVLPKYGNVSKDCLVYINLSNNKSAVAVGATCLSSFDMERSGGKGKCITIYHFLGDNLCGIDGYSVGSVPNMGPPEWLTLKSYDSDFPELGKAKRSEDSPNDTSELVDTTRDNLDDEELQQNNETDSALNDNLNMDDLLYHCFLSSIKYSKTMTLPILTSNFYKLQMLSTCPPGVTLDVKKTSYKKLKTFLDEMCKMGLITIKEIKKGVEAITNINKEHPKYNEFYLKPELRPKIDSGENPNQSKTTITESYIITDNVLPIFQQDGYRKGDIINGVNIKKIVTGYIKINNCQEVDNGRLVRPNTDVLKKVCKTEQSVTWEEVFEKVCESMKNCFKVNVGRDEIINKGKISPITMNVALRSGNKKVTLIDNLEVFGININEFAKECQHGVAASTSIIPKPPGKKCDQLLVQGNQVIFVYNLLSEKYKIPKKYILGLEKAPKKKK